MLNEPLIKINDRERVIVDDLPSYKGGKIEIYTTIEVDQEREAREKYPHSFDKNHSDSDYYSYQLLEYAIIDWNFSDDDGVKLPINIDSIKKLGMRDIIYVMTKIMPSKDDIDFVNKKKENI